MRTLYMSLKKTARRLVKEDASLSIIDVQDGVEDFSIAHISVVLQH